MNKIKRVFLGLLIGLPSLFFTNLALADEPFIGEMRYFAGNFAPRGWAFCEGQLISISSNTALFSLLGTMYGGDGRTTFALPDMRGRALVHAGNGPGLSNRNQGSKFGSETVTMSVSQMPSHQHTLHAVNEAPNTAIPNGNALAEVKMYKSGATPDKSLHGDTITSAGGNQTISTLQPTLALNCIIATQGLFPSRS